MNAQLEMKIARSRHGSSQVADSLGVSVATSERWARRGLPKSRSAGEVIDQLRAIESASLRVADLFAGIGGIRLGFEMEGYECVFTSERDRFATETYVANFGGDEHDCHGDITEVDPDSIPDHDVLLAGFPCQPFSIAGVAKKNSLGRPHGFADRTQGTLFFNVAEVIDAKRPQAFVLENVKNLRSHDKGRTLATILDVLRNDLGYSVNPFVLDGSRFVPQSRQRLAIVGFRSGPEFDDSTVSLPAVGPRMSAILHRADGSEPYLPWDGDRFFDHEVGAVQDRFTITPRLWSYLQGYAAKHRAAGNGFGFGLVGPEDVARTLSARYYKDGSEILVSQPGVDRPRRLTPRECARLMGFPDEFLIPVSDSQAYKQFGNSVVVPAFRQLAAALRPRVGEVQVSVPQKTLF